MMRFYQHFSKNHENEILIGNKQLHSFYIFLKIVKQKCCPQLLNILVLDDYLSRYAVVMKPQFCYICQGYN